jgi:hypothetical protein
VEATLAAAIRETFARRQIPLPTETPIALTRAFAEDAAKTTQWRAFVDRSRLANAAPRLSEVRGTSSCQRSRGILRQTQRRVEGL